MQGRTYWAVRDQLEPIRRPYDPTNLQARKGRVGPLTFSSHVTFACQLGVRTRVASIKVHVSSAPAWLRADSVTNLIKQGKLSNADRVAR